MGLICFILISFSVIAQAWTPSDRNLYVNRHFIELEHRMVMQNKISIVKKLREQEEDLGGCRSLHHGRGGLEAMISCIHFIDREDDLGLKTPGTTSLIRDINILCRELVMIPGNTEKMVETRAFGSLNLERWSTCRDLAWKQVYLTAYANFNADPVGTLAYVRRAQGNLKGNSSWIDKTLRLFDQIK